MFPFRASTVALLALLSPTAWAEDRPRGELVSEIKLGVLQHDIRLIAAASEPGQAINGEILFRSPDFLRPVWSPRPHLGATVSLDGETDQVYAGLTWTFSPFDGGTFAPVWLSAFGGGAVHDGQRETNSPDENSLGSPVLFRFGAEIGIDISDRASISAYFAHVSNAFLVDRNEGLDQAGLRVGWRF